MIFVVSMCLKFANLPSPLVDCGGIINAKEDPFEIKDKVHEGSKLALSQKLMKFCYIVCVCLP